MVVLCQNLTTVIRKIRNECITVFVSCILGQIDGRVTFDAFIDRGPRFNRHLHIRRNAVEVHYRVNLLCFLMGFAHVVFPFAVEIRNLISIPFIFAESILDRFFYVIGKSINICENRVQLIGFPIIRQAAIDLCLDLVLGKDFVAEQFKFFLCFFSRLNCCGINSCYRFSLTAFFASRRCQNN